MLSGLFNSTTIPVLEQVVNFSQQRHEILATNLANIDTPGYRVRDLSTEAFQDQLGRAIKDRDRRQSFPTAHQYSTASSSDLSHVRDSLKDILYHDDSNVSIERQVAEITKNQTQHNLALTVMNSQFRLLQAVISERA
jgi:flagellar basal-body rod protein FlgB